MGWFSDFSSVAKKYPGGQFRAHLLGLVYWSFQFREISTQNWGYLRFPTGFIANFKFKVKFFKEGESDVAHLHISRSHLYIYRVVTIYTYKYNRKIWRAKEQDTMNFKYYFVYLKIWGYLIQQSSVLDEFRIGGVPFIYLVFCYAFTLPGVIVNC